MTWHADDERLQKIVVDRVLDAINGLEVHGSIVRGQVRSGKTKAPSVKGTMSGGKTRPRAKGQTMTIPRGDTNLLGDADFVITLTDTDTRELGNVIAVAIKDAVGQFGYIQTLGDPSVKHIAEIVERTLPKARREKSERTIERIVDALVEAEDPLASINNEIAAANGKARHDFLGTFATLTAEDVNRNADSKAKNQHQTASRWKNEGKIFSVPFQGKDRFPAFQFKDGRPLGVIADVLKMLPAEMSAWEIAFWFVSTNGWLDDQSPIDCLKTPDQVVEAARLESEDIAG